MITTLPVEIVLTILAFLPLRQLQRLRKVSRNWTVFFVKYESAIYHAAAILHGFVPLDANLSQCKMFHDPWLAEVHTWKDLCMEHYAMERRWETSGPVRYATVGAAGETTHRFKIDTEQRTVITTHLDGGLRVCGIDEDEILWSLPRSTVHPWAHCEFDKGFLIFTRIGEAMEVWRRKRDARNNLRTSSLDPDLHQHSASRSSWQSSSSISQDDRGAFVPWTLIVPPNPVRALRLVFPTLLVASPGAQEAYLYDIVTGAHKQTISLRLPHEPSIDVNYVELGERHIFVCTTNDVVVLPRYAAHSQATWKFPSQAKDFDRLYAENKYKMNQNYDDIPLFDFTPTTLPILEKCSIKPPVPHLESIEPRDRIFTAVHVSPCGSHFVATDMKGCLYIVRDFEKVICGTLPFSHCVTMLDLSQPITYLALDGDRRICIHVKDRGIFIIPFVSPEAAPANTLDMCPQNVYPRLLHVNCVGPCDTDPCIQMTRTELWTKRYVAIGFWNGTNRLCYLDFSKPQLHVIL